MKRTFAVLFALCATGAWASFGPLTPSAEPVEREYIWPEGKMPDFQPHQIGAKMDDAQAAGFDPDANRRPYIEWYAPNPACKTNLCMLVISGGGFRHCCDRERLQPSIDRFVKAGFTVASLTYRTPWPKDLPIYQSGWEDAQRAVRIIRSQAERRGFAPEKIGALGISAGSKLVLLLATSSLTPAYAPVDELDQLPCNLLFAVPEAPAYVLTDGKTSANTRDGDAVGVRLVDELKFDAKTCPLCLVQGGADPISPNGSVQVYRQLRRMKIPAELHLFADRAHDFQGDLNRGEDGTGYDHWFYRVMEFIRQMNYDGRLGEEEQLMERFPDDEARGSYEKQDVWPAGQMPDAQTNQCTPYLEWHMPKTLKTKAIQIVYSGGSYTRNAPDGYEVAPMRRYLNAKGMAVVTLKYRTPRPLGGLAKHTTAWQDLQRTIRLVRSEAASRGLDPDRIGIMGSSAGGHLTLMGATSSRRNSYLPVDKVDNLPCNVQWAVAIYPAYALTDGAEEPNAQGGNGDDARLVPEFSFDLSTCPVLFVHGDADGWAAMNSVKCWEHLRRMGIQGELHTLATRQHCFQGKAAPGTGSYTWMDRIWEFMNAKDFNRPCVAWPMDDLRKPPACHPATDYATNGVQVAFLEGLPYHGKPTKVFCYYGVPKHAPGEKVPGMVLVHGGGGSAFYRWVRFWNDRGYAAIAMDTCGCVSGNTVGNEQFGHFRHAAGGPAGWGGFDQLDEDVRDQWLYHAVADVILCNSFLRSQEGVDPDRIGLTGVSWGAVISCIVASQDDRFRFAAPVYGCGGFLTTDAAPMWKDGKYRVGETTIGRWCALWDPLLFLPQAKMPIRWLAGTNDHAFSVPALMESYRAVCGEKGLSVKVRLPHAHGKVSEEAVELTTWADHYLRGQPLPPSVRAELNYTTDGGDWTDRTWQTVPAALVGNGAKADIPTGATAWYYNVITKDGAVASTPVETAPGHGSW